MKTNTPTYPELQRYLPTRSPAWRWERAQALVEAGRHFSTKRDDAPTGRAVAYLRSGRQGRGASQVERVARPYPDIHAARQLHDQDAKPVVEVQARLLARQSLAEIARRTGVPVDVLDMYEALFFSVVGHLDARDWITTQAVRWWEFNPATGRDAATVLRAFAYHAGPILLDAALPYLFADRMEVPLGGESTTAAWGLDRSLRLALMIEALPWGAKTDAKVFQLHAQLLAGDRKPAAARGNGTAVAQNAAEMLAQLTAGALPPSVGQTQTPRADSAKVGILEIA